jgi:hypothetical protein
VIPYREFQPTGFDACGLSLPDRQDWLVAPCSRTRDSGCLDESNWRVQQRELDRLDEEGTEHEVHRFGHWGPGWFELILVRPDTACAEWAQRAEESLSDYLVLDESDFSDLEYETARRVWRSMRYRDRSVLLALHHLERRLARRAYPPPDLDLSTLVE